MKYVNVSEIVVSCVIVLDGNYMVYICVIVVWCGDVIDGDFVGVGVFYCIQYCFVNNL